MQGMVQKIKDREKHMPLVGSVLSSMVNSLISSVGEQAIIRKPVREILFDGYKVDIFDKLQGFLRSFNVHLPQMLPNNTFGVMYGVS